MRVALFGGTFDPIHSGHVQAVLTAADSHGIERVLVIPSGNPPHKPDQCRASYAHRYRMVELACEADPRLEPSRLEEPLATGQANYSIDTIRRVQSLTGSVNRVGFIIGVDALAEVEQWRAARDVAESVEFLVLGRPDFDLPDTAFIRSLRMDVIPCSHPASSRTLRHRARIGGSLADLAPPDVCAYIWERDLYRA